jgi:hypothetical protein
MLTIRAAQLQAFEEIQLHRWIARYIRSCYPARIASEGAIIPQVSRAVAQGRARGLEAAFEIRKYVHLAFLADWALESSESFAWARAILEDEELGGPGDRVQRLETVLLEPAGGRR